MTEKAYKFGSIVVVTVILISVLGATSHDYLTSREKFNPNPAPSLQLNATDSRGNSLYVYVIRCKPNLSYLTTVGIAYECQVPVYDCLVGCSTNRSPTLSNRIKFTWERFDNVTHSQTIIPPLLKPNETVGGIPKTFFISSPPQKGQYILRVSSPEEHFNIQFSKNISVEAKNKIGEEELAERLQESQDLWVYDRMEQLTLQYRDSIYYLNLLAILILIIGFIQMSIDIFEFL